MKFVEKISTTHREIVAFWTLHQDECGLSVDWAEASRLCWRCAHKRQLQMCHIIPRALGGSDDPSNLVLLCAQCHAEAPNVADAEFMWLWLRAHATSFYGTYWQMRGEREYELIYGEKPFFGIAGDEEVLLRRCKEVLEDVFPRASRHWGQGKLNPATWAWVFRQVHLSLRDGL